MSAAFKKFITILAVFAFFIAILNVVIDNPYTSRIVTGLVNDFVEKHAPVNVEFQAVSIRAFPPRLKIFGIKVNEKLKSDETGDAKPLTFLRLESLELGLSAESMLFGSSKFFKIAINGPVFDDNTMSNIETLLKEMSESSPGSQNNNELRIPWLNILDSIPIAELTVDHARVEHSRKLANGDVAKVLLLDALLDIEIDDRNGVEVILESDGLNLLVNDMAFVRSGKTRIEARASSDRKAKFNLTLSDSGLTFGVAASGDLKIEKIGIEEFIKSGTFSLDYLASVKLENFCKTAGIEAEGNSGTAETKGTVTAELGLLSQFSLQKMEGKSSITGNNLSFMGYFFGNLKVEARHTADTIDVTTLEVSDTDVPLVTASGKISGLTSGKPTFSGTAKTIPDLLLSRILRASDVDFSEFDFGVESAEIFINGTANPFSLDLRSPSTILRNLTLKSMEKETISMELEPVDCSGPLHMSFSEKQIEIKQTPLSCDFRASTSTAQASLLSISGPITYEPKTGMSLLVSARDMSLNLLQRIVAIPVANKGDIDLRIHGPYSRISVDIDLKSNSLLTYNTTLNNVVAKVGIVDSKLNWSAENILIEGGGRILETKGSLALNELLTLNVAVNASDIAKEGTVGLLSYFHLPEYSGEIAHLEADLEFELGLGRFLPTGTLSVEGSKWKLAENGKVDWFKSDLDFGAHELKVRRILGEIDDLQVDLKGEIQTFKSSTKSTDEILDRLRMRRESAVAAQISLKSAKANQDGTKTALAPLQSLPIIGQYLKQMQLNGFIDGQATLTGKVAEVSSKLDFAVSRVTLAETRLADLRVKGTIVKNKLDAMLTQSDKTLGAEFKLDLNSSQLDFEWSIAASRWNIAPYILGSVIKDARNYLYLSASSSMAGNFRDFWKSAKGQLSVSQFEGKFFNPSNRSGTPIDIRVPGSITLNLEQQRLHSQNKSIQFTGDAMDLSIDLVGQQILPSQLNVGVKGLLNLEVLRQFFPLIETSSGVLRVEGSVKGALSDLHPVFEVKNVENREQMFGKMSQIEDFSSSLGIEAVRPAITDIRVHLILTRDGLDIKSFQAQKGPGKISASGLFEFNPERTTNSRISVVLERASFIHNSSVLKTVEAEVSGNLAIATGRQPILLAGNIEIDRARNLQNVDIRDKIIEFVQTRKFDSTSESKKAFINFDLNIQSKDTIKIRNRNIQAEASCNLNLGGSNETPILTGQIIINRGSFSYKYRRDFRISQGILTFDDPLSLDPKIDLSAQSEISTYRVSMLVSGRASEPRIDLTCDPSIRPDGLPVTKVDIVTLISSGRMNTNTRSNISAGDTAAVETLNLVYGKFEEPLEKFLDWSGLEVVQTLNIDTYADDSGKPIPRLSVPLNLHDDWDVVFSADDANQKVSLGYDINRDISLSGSVDRKNNKDSLEQTSRQSSTDTGVDLKFRFSFP